MSREPHQRVERWLLGLVAVFFAVAIPYTLYNVPSQRVGEARGVVQTTRGLHGDTRPTTQVLTVKLASGEVVLAQTLPGIMADEGDTAFVRSYRRRLSGAISHEVYRVDRGRPN